MCIGVWVYMPMYACVWVYMPMCTCVYVSLYMCGCMCSCICVWYTCPRVHECEHTCPSVHVCDRTCPPVHEHGYTCPCVHVWACMLMCTWVWIYMPICTCGHTCPCVHVCGHTCSCVRVWVCMSICTHVCTCPCVRVWHTSSWVHMFEYTCPCVHVWVYMLMCTWVWMYMPMCSCWGEHWCTALPLCTVFPWDGNLLNLEQGLWPASPSNPHVTISNPVLWTWHTHPDFSVCAGDVNTGPHASASPDTPHPLNQQYNSNHFYDQRPTRSNLQENLLGSKVERIWSIRRWRQRSRRARRLLTCKHSWTQTGGAASLWSPKADSQGHIPSRETPSPPSAAAQAGH